MTKILIDNKEYEVNKEKNLLDTCLSLGFDIPYFCFHPALGSVGACRLCAVKKFNDENDTKGKIIMSCMEPVQEGMRISTDDPEVLEFRAAVIESLMINHPHDCPVCDEGGECHLQDMTVMTGHTYRNYEFKKRTHRNQDLGPYINHEMNRCIQCYRCVRYYRDYAGGRDLDVFAARNSLYFGRSEDGTLESEFSGNLVEVCPTGVFTDKTLKRHYTRKWDFTNSPSICPHCSIGCNIIISERYGILRRVLNRYNSEVNGYFICNRGRFGYEFVNSDKRFRNILQKNKNTDEFRTINKDELFHTIKNIFSTSKTIVGIGSAKESLESNYVLKQFVGKENFYIGTSQKEYILTKKILEVYTKTPARIPSLKDIEKADAVLILGEDIMKTAPMAALAVRQTILNSPFSILNSQLQKIPRWNDQAVRNLIQDEKGPLFIALSTINEQRTTILDDVASDIYRATPEAIAKLGFAITGKLNSKYPAVKDLSQDIIKKADEIAETLKNAKNPLIISGTSSRNIDIINASADIADALCEGNKTSNLFYIVSDCNSLGLFMLDGKPIEELMDEHVKINCAIILENDLFEKEGKNRIEALLNNCDLIISLAHSAFSIQHSGFNIVLPVSTFAESNGTYVNNEGRAQRFYSVFPYNDDIKESWKWLNDLRINQKSKNDFKTFDELLEVIAKDYPVFNGIQDLSPYSLLPTPYSKIPRQTFRFSGRTAIYADIDVSEQKPPDDDETPLAFTMEGYKGKPPSALIPFYWSPSWNSVQALNKYQKHIGGNLTGGDPGIKLIIKNK